MPTQYNGKVANYVPASAIAIASSSNTNPIVITTSSAHGLNIGDTIDVVGHQANYTANGTWIVPAYDYTPTTFAIPATAGVAAGGATGTVQDLGGGSYSIPADGDADNAASVNVAFEALGDTSAFLLNATGAYKLVSLTQVIVNSDVGASWLQITPGSGAPSATWYSAPAASGIAVVGVDANTNDMLHVVFDGNLEDATGGFGASVVRIGLCSAGYYPGSTPPAGTHIPGSTKYLLGYSLSAGAPQQVHLEGWVASPTYPNFTFTLGMIFIGTISTGYLNMLGDYSFTVYVWRPTGQPQ